MAGPVGGPVCGAAVTPAPGRAPAGRAAGARGRVGARIGSLVGLALAVLMLVSGCAQLPTSSSPQALGTVERDAGVADVPTPTPGKAPDLMLRDFLKASGEPGGRHSAARKFLTDSASKDWDDTTSTSIVDKVDVFFDERSADSATLLISAAKVGKLDHSGTFRSDQGTLEARVRMVRRDDEWRIDKLPDGVIIARSQFLNAYHQVQLYFLDPSGTTVVADPRWLSLRANERAAQLISMLIDGPNPLLADAIQTRFGPDVHLRSTLTKLDGRDSNVGVGIGGVKMDFQGIGDLGPEQRKQFAAQIVWTLSASGVGGPYQILSDGAPLDPAVTKGYTTEDVAAFAADAGVADVGLHAVKNGALVAMTDSGAVPVPGPLGRTDSVVGASLSRDAKKVAAVRRTDDPNGRRSELVVGTYGAASAVVASGSSISRPTWSPDGSVWVAVDGDTVKRITAGPDDSSTENVGIGDVTKIGGPITALRLSQDGVRAAMIVDGKVFIAYVTPTPDGGVELSSPRAIGSSLDGDAVSLSWSGHGWIGVVQSGDDTAPVQMSFEGLSEHTMSSRNLAPPLSLIEMTPETIYVVDSRGVMRRAREPGQDQQFWREVPGLMGSRSVPVTPG